MVQPVQKKDTPLFSPAGTLFEFRLTQQVSLEGNWLEVSGLPVAMVQRFVSIGH
jgi:hypothetical protein